MNIESGGLIGPPLSIPSKNRMIPSLNAIHSTDGPRTCPMVFVGGSTYTTSLHGLKNAGKTSLNENRPVERISTYPMVLVGGGSKYPLIGLDIPGSKTLTTPREGPP